jgi:hypothetical protein
MERTHQLIKLKVGTVQNLKHLKTEMGLNSLDSLISTMIRVTNEHRLVYKNTGWIGSPKEKLKNQ